MKLVIFIGHFKTGSSSLQRYLSRNAHAFLKAGTLYPAVESLGLAYQTATALNGADFDEVSHSLNITEPHNALALKLKTEEDGHGVPPYYPDLPSGHQMFSAIDNQMLLFEPETTVLCSEVFALFGQTKEQQSLKRMAKRFAHHDVTIIANLRRPDEYLHSWHRQRLKFGDPKLQPLSGSALRSYSATSHLRYGKMVNSWVRAFPKAKLILRDFEAVKAAGGSVEDFFIQTEISRPEGLVDPGDFNPSVPAAFAEIARRALAENPREDAKGFVPFLLTARRIVDHPEDNKIEPFGPENRARLVEIFAPQNPLLGKLAGRDLFFDNAEDFARLREHTELEAAQMVLPALKDYAADSALNDHMKTWMAGLTL